MRGVRKLGVCVFGAICSAFAPGLPRAGPPDHCFESNGLRVCHSPADRSVFYDTPPDRVAYNVQTVHDGARYWTIYHAEPLGPLRGGDSIRAGLALGAYRFRMPPHTSQVGGVEGDPASLLDSDGVGGGGNPMVVSGRPGDPFFYVFFLGVSDDARVRDHKAGDWRHYLIEARTKDFAAFDIKTAAGWASFTAAVRPAPSKDANGNVIRSNTPRTIDKTQGLIGSISYVRGVYHYFYLDYAPDGASIHLYHRTSTDVAHGVWSAPETVAAVADFSMIRVAKAKTLDRWAVLYGCYAQGVQDVCVQYTKTLAVIGPGGLSDLRLTSDYALGLSADGKARSYAQPDWLTDRWGVLDTVGPHQAEEFYWTDMDPENCKARPIPYCPVAGGVVYRAGWTVSGP